MPAFAPPPAPIPARLRLAVAGLVAAYVVAACAGPAPVGSAGGAPTTPAGVATALASGAAPVSAGAPAATAGGTTVGLGGIAAWDALSDAERALVRTQPILYLHQSVGQDLEDGAEAGGFEFAYFGPGQARLEPGLNGGIFTDVGAIANGEPMAKMELVRRVATSVAGQARVVSFSFGYADIRDEDLAGTQAAYQRLVADIKATGARFVHVTPPLVYSTVENPPKMAFRRWMLEAFAGDVIFDLQDAESLDQGARCEEGGTWRICQANRSTTACPSLGQGIDEDGAGHLCAAKAAGYAKAMLYAYYLAAR